jgi:hypothetical protein
MEINTSGHHNRNIIYNNNASSSSSSSSSSKPAAVNRNNKPSLQQRINTAIPSFVRAGGLTESVKSPEQKRKEVWAESVYSTVLASVFDEQGGETANHQPFPLTVAKVSMFVRACSHLGYTFGSIRNSILPALKRINIDRFGVDVELDATKSLEMKQAFAYSRKYAEDDEAGEGNPFTIYDWKYVSTTLPVDSPDYWRDCLILLFPLMTAARCITLGNFRDCDIISIERIGDGRGSRDEAVGEGSHQDVERYKMVLNLKVTKNNDNWNKKMVVYGKIERHSNWQEDIIFIINQYLLERSGVGVIEFVERMKTGEFPGDRLFLDKAASPSSSITVAALMNNLRHVFSHRIYMAGYPERFFHFHDARAGFLSTIIILYTPESFHNLPSELIPRWKPSTLYDYFQARMKDWIRKELLQSQNEADVDVDGIYAELCRRALIRNTEWNGLVDTKSGGLRPGVLNDCLVLKAFSHLFQSASTNDVRQAMMENIKEWMTSYRRREGRPSASEIQRYLNLIPEPHHQRKGNAYMSGL